MKFKPSEKSLAGWHFLALAVIIYAVVYFLKPEVLLPSLRTSYGITLKIIPTLLLVFVLMTLTNYFVDPKILVKYLGKSSGIKGWLIAIGAGILSTGPIYMWYPLLSDLKKKGMRTGLLAAFLYNRAVKPALVPLMIIYFSLKFVCVLTLIMILASVAEGWIVEKLMEVKLWKQNKQLLSHL